MAELETPDLLRRDEDHDTDDVIDHGTHTSRKDTTDIYEHGAGDWQDQAGGVVTD
jgi:hypothetical protein